MLPDLVFSPAIEQWRPWIWNGECISVRGARCFQAIINTAERIMWDNVMGTDGDRGGLGSFRGGNQVAFEEAMCELRTEWSKKPGTCSPIHLSTHKVNFLYIHSALATSSLSLSYSDLSLLSLVSLFSFQPFKAPFNFPLVITSSINQQAPNWPENPRSFLERRRKWGKTENPHVTFFPVTLVK